MDRKGWCGDVGSRGEEGRKAKKVMEIVAFQIGEGQNKESSQLDGVLEGRPGGDGFPDLQPAPAPEQDTSKERQGKGTTPHCSGGSDSGGSDSGGSDSTMDRQ